MYTSKRYHTNTHRYGAQHSAKEEKVMLLKIKKDSEGNQQKQEEKELIIMTKGKPIDYFVLIIEGT